MKNFFIFIFITSLLVPTQIISQDRNFFLETWKTKNFSAPVNFNENNFTENQADVTVNVYLHDSINKILPTQLGLNTTFRSTPEMVTDRIPLYENSGWGAYRYPAGSGSNIYFWDGNIPSDFAITIEPIDGTKSTNVTPGNFVTFKQSLSSEASIVVNYFYARYGVASEDTRDARVKQAADYAAAFVSYMNDTLGANIKYWEVGNECYGAWEEGYIVDGDTIDGKEYGEDFCVFAQAMRAADPDIKIGTVMYSDTTNSKYGIWNKLVLNEVKDAADFFVVHNYFTGGTPTKEELLASTIQISEIKNMFDTLTKYVAQKPENYYPVAMTEYNSRGQFTTTMLNAIFTAEVLGEFMKNNYGMATRWVGEWGWAEDTHGTIAKTDDPQQDPYTPRQAYMIYRYYDLYFGDYLINVTSDHDSVKVYASRFSDGKIGLTVINQTAQTKNIKITVADDENIQLTTAYWYEVYADNIDTVGLGNTKFYVNGETSTTAGGGPTDIENVLPYKSAITANSVFNAKQYSVSFLVFDAKDLTTSTGMLQFDNIKIYPNPVNDILKIDCKEKIKSIKLFDLGGQIIYSEENPNKFIKLQNLKAGQYLIKIDTWNNVFLKKIIKIE